MPDRVGKGKRLGKLHKRSPTTELGLDPVNSHFPFARPHDPLQLVDMVSEVSWIIRMTIGLPWFYTRVEVLVPAALTDSPLSLLMLWIYLLSSVSTGLWRGQLHAT